MVSKTRIQISQATDQVLSDIASEFARTKAAAVGYLVNLALHEPNFEYDRNIGQNGIRSCNYHHTIDPDLERHYRNIHNIQTNKEFARSALHRGLAIYRSGNVPRTVPDKVHVETVRSIPNPALDNELSIRVTDAKVELLRIVDELMARNDPDHDKIRLQLVAYLKAILLFLGEGMPNPPPEIPTSLPREAHNLSKQLTNTKGKAKDAADTGLSITRILDTIFSWLA